MREIAVEKDWVECWESTQKLHEDLFTLIELAEAEEDRSVLPEIEAEFKKLTAELDDLELRATLGEEEDSKSAILNIHPGAGGTESQDWAEMLMRMFLRWAERRGFKSEILDFQEGEVAGVKNVTIEIQGSYAYGYLKSENGIHRLVRISPFNSNGKRHTSFTSVFVMPEVEENVDIEINPKDLRIDTYRASGAGGQHVNKTDSAIRITHIPTNTVVQCQNERSQQKNKASAMKILASRLYQLQKEEERKKMEKYTDTKSEIGWGNQIRSYVFHPYNLVKDHRTNAETSNIQSVMDGGLDEFIQAYLKSENNRVA